MNKKIIYKLLLILLLHSHVFAINRFIANKKKKYVASDPLHKNIMRGFAHPESFLQTGESETQNSFRREDMYLWEEGVTKLAYDDFLTTKFINNIEYLGSGYNIMFGNPLTTQGVDPGYTKLNAFEFNYQNSIKDSLTADADYFIPDNVNLKTQTACEISFDSKDISTLSDYQQSLSVSAKFEYKSFWGGGFSASAEYKESKRNIEETDKTYVFSSASCAVHSLGISRYDIPKLSKDFKAALKYLLRTKDRGEVHKLYTRYGTHVTMGVDLGSKFGYMYEMNSKKVQEMRSRSYSVSGAASGFGFSGGLSAGHDSESHSAFSNAMENSIQFSIGAAPNADNDALEWATQSMTSPMPIRGEFMEWADILLLSKEREDNGFTSDEMDQLINLFQDGSQTYCSHYLIPYGYVDECYTKAQADIFGKQLNIPGGTIGLDNSSFGGYIYYSWELIDSLKKYFISKVSSDERGSVFAIAIGQDRRHYIDGPILLWQVPNSNEFQEMNLGNIPRDRQKVIRTVSAGDNKIIVGFKTEGDHLDFYYNNYDNSGRWYRMDTRNQLKDLRIDQNGILISINVNDMVCIHRDMTTQPDCSDRRAYWLDTVAGTIYAGDSDNSYIIKYNRMGIKSYERVDEGNIRSACITLQGWGYKQEGYTDIYYQPFVGKKKVNNVNEGHAFYDIFCKSTESGPLVIGIDQNHKAYYRKAHEYVEQEDDEDDY